MLYVPSLRSVRVPFYLVFWLPLSAVFLVLSNIHRILDDFTFTLCCARTPSGCPILFFFACLVLRADGAYCACFLTLVLPVVPVLMKTLLTTAVT